MIYAFRCNGCDKMFERRRPVEKRDEPAACDWCESLDTKRVIGKGVKVWHPSKS